MAHYLPTKDSTSGSSRSLSFLLLLLFSKRSEKRIGVSGKPQRHDETAVARETILSPPFHHTLGSFPRFMHRAHASSRFRVYNWTSLCVRPNSRRSEIEIDLLFVTFASCSESYSLTRERPLRTSYVSSKDLVFAVIFVANIVKIITIIVT